MKIFKYRLSERPNTFERHPVEGWPVRVLDAGLDHSGMVCVWVEVDDTAELGHVVTYAAFAGFTLDPDLPEFVRTVVDREGLVWHVYAGV